MSSLRFEQEVTMLVASIGHPMENLISDLRELILETDPELKENIKWNGPNYVFNGQDRITLRVQSPKLVQVILHCGAKKQVLDKPVIADEHPLLEWKSFDRAIITFKNTAQFETAKADLSAIFKNWLSH